MASSVQSSDNRTLIVLERQGVRGSIQMTEPGLGRLAPRLNRLSITVNNQNLTRDDIQRMAASSDAVAKVAQKLEYLFVLGWTEIRLESFRSKSFSNQKALATSRAPFALTVAWKNSSSLNNGLVSDTGLEARS